MIYIGDKQVIFNHSFIIPPGQTAKFRAPSDLAIEIELKFKDGEGDKEPSVSWEFAEEILVMTFIGWKNSLGTALKKPVKLGDLSDGRPFGFNVVHQMAGEVHFLTLEMYVGGQY